MQSHQWFSWKCTKTKGVTDGTTDGQAVLMSPSNYICPFLWQAVWKINTELKVGMMLYWQHQRLLLWQPLKLPVITKLASWRLSVFSVHITLHCICFFGMVQNIISNSCSKILHFAAHIFLYRPGTVCCPGPQTKDLNVKQSIHKSQFHFANSKWTG